MAFLDHLLLQAAQAVAAACRRDHAGAFPREEDGSLAADAAGGAQYEDNLIFQRDGHAQIVARLAGARREEQTGSSNGIRKRKSGFARTSSGCARTSCLCYF